MGGSLLPRTCRLDKLIRDLVFPDELVRAHIAASSSNISPFPSRVFGICLVLPSGEDASNPLGEDIGGKLQIQDSWMAAEDQRMPGAPERKSRLLGAPQR